MNKSIIPPKLYEKDIMYGTTTMGPKGQVVIPAEARRDMNLNVGDRLLVMGKFGKVLGLMKADDIENFVSTIMNSIMSKVDDEKFKDHIKKHATELLKYIKK